MKYIMVRSKFKKTCIMKDVDKGNVDPNQSLAYTICNSVNSQVFPADPFQKLVSRFGIEEEMGQDSLYEEMDL